MLLTSTRAEERERKWSYLYFQLVLSKLFFVKMKILFPFNLFFFFFRLFFLIHCQMSSKFSFFFTRFSSFFRTMETRINECDNKYHIFVKFTRYTILCGVFFTATMHLNFFRLILRGYERNILFTLWHTNSTHG